MPALIVGQDSSPAADVHVGLFEEPVLEDPSTVENPLQPVESAAGGPGRPPQAEGLPHRAFITIRGPPAHPAQTWRSAPHSGKPQAVFGVPLMMYVVGWINSATENQGETPCNSLSPNSRRISRV